MANLTFLEKNQLEKLLGMASGYVLNFSDRTFREFIADATGKDIFDRKYAYASGSKANRLRAFWRDEPNHVVGSLLVELLRYQVAEGFDPADRLYGECHRITERLLRDAPVQEAQVISAISSEKDFEAVAKGVRDAIERNELEAGLDRLHTFAIKYVRHLCVKHGIAVDRDKPLHSLFGEYVKELKKLGHLESEMTERILKSSISILDAFNDVRKQQESRSR
ncbi:MAG: abortive infection family protein [Candidatus Sulfotelmatobacter sp.]